MENFLFDRLTFTPNELSLMCNFEQLKILSDIKEEKNERKREIKKEWLSKWQDEIVKWYKSFDTDENVKIFKSVHEFDTSVFEELKNNQEDKNWYYMMVLESELFTPYFPLYNDENEIGQLKTINFNNQNRYVYDIVSIQNIIDGEFVDKVKESYKKSIYRISKMTSKIIMAADSSAITSGIAAYFASLHGTKESAKMNESIFINNYLYSKDVSDSGVRIIAGGASLLKPESKDISLFLLKNQDLTMVLVAKLESVFKEIVLNIQKDIKYAEMIANEFQKLIHYYEDILIELIRRDIEDEKKVKEVQSRIDYFNKLYLKSKLNQKNIQETFDQYKRQINENQNKLSAFQNIRNKHIEELKSSEAAIGYMKKLFNEMLKLIIYS